MWPLGLIILAVVLRSFASIAKFCFNDSGDWFASGRRTLGMTMFVVGWSYVAFMLIAVVISFCLTLNPS
jgi:hypothetical protein